MTSAVERSVFFIPIVTPRAVNSQYCQFEFDAFLKRERALGRTDLVFPILYVPVPALGKSRRNGATIRSSRLSASGSMSIGRRSAFQILQRPPCGRRSQASPAGSSRRCTSHGCRPKSESSGRSPRLGSVRERERRRLEAEAKRRVEDETRREAAKMEAQRIAEGSNSSSRSENPNSEQRTNDAGKKSRTASGPRKRRAERNPSPRRGASPKRLGRRREKQKRTPKLPTGTTPLSSRIFLTATHPVSGPIKCAPAFAYSIRQKSTGLFLPIVLGILVFLAVLGAILVASGAFNR